MNKSLQYVNGDWVCFMNAGDKFYNDNVISDIFNVQNINNYNLVYGNHSFIKKNKLLIKYPKSIKTIWKGMPMCHQSIFTKTSLLTSLPFNINYKFAADYDFIYSQYINAPNEILYINKTISIITTGGFSENNSTKTYIEYKNVSLSKQYKLSKKVYFIFRILERQLASLIKYFLKYK